MRIIYREGEATILAEVDEISIQGSTLMAHLRSGKVIQRPFLSEQVLNEFFEEVILPAGDNPIHLENTNFDPRLGELLDAWDSMYDD
jgi:hypothetical protein